MNVLQAAEIALKEKASVPAQKLPMIATLPTPKAKARSGARI